MSASRPRVGVRLAGWFRRVYGPLTEAERAEAATDWFASGGW